MQRLFSLGLTAILTATPAAIAQQQLAMVAGPVTNAIAPKPAFTTTIQGNALTSSNGQLINVPVRLRDARYGRIVDTQMTDKSGLFAFRSVEPGSYIVEIMSADETSVLAASQILSANAGEMVSAIVKLPFRVPPSAGILGGHAASAATPASAIAVMSQAAANSVLIVARPPGAVDNCPLQKP